MGTEGTGLIKRTKGLTPDMRQAVTDHVMELCLASYISERGNVRKAQELSGSEEQTEEHARMKGSEGELSGPGSRTSVLKRVRKDKMLHKKYPSCRSKKEMLE